MWACTLFTVTLSWVVFTSKPPTARYDRLLVPAPQQEHVSPPKVVAPSPQMATPASMLGNSHCATTAQKVLGPGGGGEGGCRGLGGAVGDAVSSGAPLALAQLTGQFCAQSWCCTEESVHTVGPFQPMSALQLQAPSDICELGNASSASRAACVYPGGHGDGGAEGGRIGGGATGGEGIPGAVGGVSKMAAPTRHSLASLQSPPPALHEAVATPAPAPWSHEPHRDRPSTVQSVEPQKSLCTLATSL